MKYYVKEGFWFHLGAFNQRNGIQCLFCINIYAISYKAAVKIHFQLYLFIFVIFFFPKGGCLLFNQELVLPCI